MFVGVITIISHHPSQLKFFLNLNFLNFLNHSLLHPTIVLLFNHKKKAWFKFKFWNSICLFVYLYYLFWILFHFSFIMLFHFWHAIITTEIQMSIYVFSMCKCEAMWLVIWISLLPQRILLYQHDLSFWCQFEWMPWFKQQWDGNKWEKDTRIISLCLKNVSKEGNGYIIKMK